MATPFIMASCAFEGGPYPFPSGYAYHHQAFKSPGGIKPKMDDADQLLSVTAVSTPYRAVDQDVMVDRSALDQVGVVPSTRQQGVFAPQFERVVE